MWTGKHTAILGAASAVSLAAGGVSGYFLAKRKLETAFELRLEEEIRTTKAFYENLYNKPDPDKLVEEIGLDVELPFEEGSKHQYDTTSDEVPTEVLERVASSMAKAQQEMDAEAQPMTNPEVPHNAFDNPAPAWNQQDEELERRNGVPYIISHDEFYNNEWEFEEGQLTYYEGDDTLADSRDEPVLNQFEAVGELTLDGDKWGHGSNDPNIIYVCNEKMEMIFEIARSTKSFTEDVLGFVEDGSPELKHGQRKFRPERDG